MLPQSHFNPRATELVLKAVKNLESDLSMKAAFSWGSGGRAGVQDTTRLVGRRSPRERGQQGRDRIGRQGAGAGQTHQIHGIHLAYASSSSTQMGKEVQHSEKKGRNLTKHHDTDPC